MEFKKTKLEGVWIIEPKIFKDERGLFFESYSKREFENQGIDIDFVQDNHSVSLKKGTLRGLHFQKDPFAQSKLVRVTKGKVYDVIVDIRKDLKTFGQWEGFELSAQNFKMLLVPSGFAHGFLTLEDDTIFQYKCSEFYHPESESGIIWNDPDLNINWPIKNPIILEKDKKHPFFKDLNL